MVKLPEIKKKVSGFLLCEEGRISKEALVGVGVVLAGVGIQAASAHTSHSSSSGLDYEKPTITGQHSSHSAHSSTTSTTSSTTSTTHGLHDNCGSHTNTHGNSTTSTTSTTSSHTSTTSTTSISVYDKKQG